MVSLSYADTFRSKINWAETIGSNLAQQESDAVPTRTAVALRLNPRTRHTDTRTGMLGRPGEGSGAAGR
jgi:hypothetical protein